MGACAPSRNTRQWSRRCCGRSARSTSPLAAAHGRVLARDVTAEVALPGFDNSAMDGYAARWAEVSGSAARPPVRLPVAEDIPAGRSDVVPLAPGTVHRIMTGAPMPPGADVVVPVELTDGATDVVEIRDAPPAGQPSARRGRGHRGGRRRAVGRHARWAPRRSGWPPPSASPPCRSGAVRACWCCPPAASWSSRDDRCGRARSTSPTRCCWPPPSRTPVARPDGCTSSRTTSTSSSPRCGPRWRRRTC